MERIVFGVDVGGTTIKAGCFTMEGRLLEKWTIPTRTQEEGRDILPDISGLIHGKISGNTVLAGVGIGVPGPVTEAGLVLGCVNLGWDTFHLEKKFSNMLGGVPVKAGNDASLAALGEYVMGAGRGCPDMVLVTLGTGVGSGIIIDGHLVTGYNGAAGEIGHMPLVPECEDTCTCGKKGCLELAASASGIVRQANRLLAGTDTDSQLRGIKSFTAKDVFELAKKGDFLSLSVIERAMDYLASGLACTASVVNPGLFLIGGGMSGAGMFLVDMLEEKFREKAFTPCGDVKFGIASLGPDAGIYGAAAQIIQSLRNERL
ncbi:ROK family glucokinase [Parasporobacterium paucivorans]|uniref:Glucokinase n=1 Tax=Parasporobacterium paucivorans DSM 15970 TaxID=1122934 RepID=A0A1M6JPV6_9FIRM|nr:ROK family glucokinase [Parasporobacterium paucivorans]SHJ48757.1 glucokinase [Parasporobacterium paucivorans DSM 15970]